jgi:hypothetical protein
MTRTDILEELGKLPADERLGIVETALHQSREQFRAGRLGDFGDTLLNSESAPLDTPDTA